MLYLLLIKQTDSSESHVSHNRVSGLWTQLLSVCSEWEMRGVQVKITARAKPPGLPSFWLCVRDRRREGVPVLKQSYGGTALPKPFVLLIIFGLLWGTPLYFPRLESQADSHTHPAFMSVLGTWVGSSFTQQTLSLSDLPSPFTSFFFFFEIGSFLSRALWLDWPTGQQFQEPTWLCLPTPGIIALSCGRQQFEFWHSCLCGRHFIPVSWAPGLVFFLSKPCPSA